MFMRSHNKLPKEKSKAFKKFLKFFPGGFSDETYIDWEREYKWNAHLEWEKQLNKKEFLSLLDEGKYMEIAKRAVNIETKTNLLFSFEKMALRDAVKTNSSAKEFAVSLFELVYGKGSFKERFMNFADILSHLPRKQTRVLTWPLQTVFAFIADPSRHIFLKPRVTQVAAKIYGFDFKYKSKVNWETYQSLLNFAEEVRKDTKSLKPVDMIDLQSYIWVMGSEEYD